MTVTIPTVDDFQSSTVMKVIRKIVNYIINDLVPSINDNDIEDVTFTLATNDNLTITIKKGDNTTITESVSLASFADMDQIADLQEQITDIKPTVTVSGNRITVSVNGTSSSATLPTGEANPYPTSIDLSVSGSRLSINIPMSGSPALTDSVKLPTGDNISQYSTFSTVVSNAKLGDIVTVFHLDGDSYGFSFTGVCINASGSGSTKDILFSGSGMLIEVTDGTQKPLNGLSMTPSVMLPLAFTKAGSAIALMPVKNNTTTSPDNIRLIHFG